MSGGKPVDVAITNLARVATRWSETQMGDSASIESSLGWGGSFWREGDLQWGMACSKVWGEAWHLGQWEERARLN